MKQEVDHVNEPQQEYGIKSEMNMQTDGNNVEKVLKERAEAESQNANYETQTALNQGFGASRKSSSQNQSRLGQTRGGNLVLNQRTESQQPLPAQDLRKPQQQLHDEYTDQAIEGGDVLPKYDSQREGPNDNNTFKGPQVTKPVS